METGDEDRDTLLRMINGESDDSDNAVSMEELVAAVRQQRRWRPGKGGGKGGDAKGGGKGASTRRCPNCGEEGHAAADCKQPKIPVTDRKCWLCGQKGHTANNCTKKKAVKSVEPAGGPGTNAKPQKVVFSVDAEGFTQVGPRGKPRKTEVTFGDFLNKDFFRGINAVRFVDAVEKNESAGSRHALTHSPARSGGEVRH